MYFSDASLAGKSRSATIMAAYLMKRFDIGVTEAISQIQDVRDVDPNLGFREQLQVFLDCNFVPNSSKAAYRHWLLREDARMQKGSAICTRNLMIDVTGKYGKPDNVNYQTAGTFAVDETGAPVVDLRCKKCRYIAALILLIIDVYWHRRSLSYCMSRQRKRSSINARTPK